MQTNAEISPYVPAGKSDNGALQVIGCQGDCAARRNDRRHIRPRTYYRVMLPLLMLWTAPPPAR